MLKLSCQNVLYKATNSFIFPLNKCLSKCNVEPCHTRNNNLEDLFVIPSSLQCTQGLCLLEKWVIKTHYCLRLTSGEQTEWKCGLVSLLERCFHLKTLTELHQSGSLSAQGQVSASFIAVLSTRAYPQAKATDVRVGATRFVVTTPCWQHHLCKACPSGYCGIVESGLCHQSKSSDGEHCKVTPLDWCQMQQTRVV